MRLKGIRLISSAMLVCFAVLLVMAGTTENKATNASTPQAKAAEASTDKTTTQALERLDDKLNKSKKNAIIVANQKGDVLREFDTETLRSDGFASLHDFATKNSKEDKCKKISPRCMKCPDGKIYCTNDKSILGIPEKSASEPQ